MKLLSAMVSKPGSQAVNEDAVGRLPPGADPGCWVVADGQGKRGGGDIGAQKAAQAVLDTVAGAAVPSGKLLERAMDAANQEILAMQAEIVRNRSIRAAAAVLCASGRDAWWAHIGDARVYALRGGEVIAQTQDHSVPQTLVKAGEISPAQMRAHPRHHHLLRALGAPDAMQPCVLEKRFNILPGDVFLLCTAGFWRHVTELEMQAEWSKSGDAQDWLERMEIRLLQAAPADYEDYSAIAVVAEE